MEQVDQALVKANAARDRTAIDWLSGKKRELYDAAQKQAAASAPQLPEGGILSGTGETLASLVSGTAATVESGWAGLAGAALHPTHPLEGFRSFADPVAQAGTYQPRTQLGQAAVGDIGRVFGALGEGGRYIGHLAGKATGGNPYVEEAIGAPLGMAGDALTSWLTAGAGRALGGIRLPGRGYEANAVDLARRGTLVTPGQARGGEAKTKEQQMTSDPILGGTYRRGQQRALESYQRTTLNEALRLLRPGSRPAQPGRGPRPPPQPPGQPPPAGGGAPPPPAGGPRAAGPRSSTRRPQQSAPRRPGRTYQGTATPAAQATGAQLQLPPPAPPRALPAPTRAPGRGGRQGQLVRPTIPAGRDQRRLPYIPPPRALPAPIAGPPRPSIMDAYRQRLTQQRSQRRAVRQAQSAQQAKGGDIIKLPRTGAQVRADIDASNNWHGRWIEEMSKRLAKANGVTATNAGDFTHYKLGDAKLAKRWQDLYQKGLAARNPLERHDLLQQLDQLGAETQDVVKPSKGQSAFARYEAEQLAKEQALSDATLEQARKNRPTSALPEGVRQRAESYQTDHRNEDAPLEERAEAFSKLPPAMQAFLAKGKPVTLPPGGKPPGTPPPADKPPGPGGLSGMHDTVMGLNIPPEANLGVGMPGVRSGGLPPRPTPPAGAPPPGSARGTGARGRGPGARSTGARPPLRVPENLTGHAAVQWTFDHVNRYYSDAVSNLRGDYDSAPRRGGQSLRQEVAGHRTVVNAANISADAKAEANRVLDEIDRTFAGGRITGGSMQHLIEYLRTRKEYFANQTQHPDVRSLALMIDDIRDGIDAMIGRVNTPNRASNYAAARKSYAIFKPAENAAAAPGTGMGSGAQDSSPRGVPTAARYQAEVRRADASRNKRQWAQGRAGPTIPPVRPGARNPVPLQTLAEQGTSVMGDVYPDSGTPGRGGWQHFLSEPWSRTNLLKLLALPGVRRQYSEAGLRRLHERILRRGTGPHHIRDNPDLMNLIRAAFAAAPAGARTAGSLGPPQAAPGISTALSPEDQAKEAMKYVGAVPQ